MGNQLNMPATTVDTDRWLTPRWVLDALGAFDLDPCGAPGWNTATEVWTPEEVGDGLSMPWRGRVWMNPPYGSASTAWLQQLAAHGTGTALIFARTDTAAWHDWVFPYADVALFLRGRLSFVRPDRMDQPGRLSGEGNSGAPSVLLAYGRNDVEHLRMSGLPGHLVDLRAQVTA